MTMIHFAPKQSQEGIYACKPPNFKLAPLVREDTMKLFFSDVSMVSALTLGVVLAYTLLTPNRRFHRQVTQPFMLFAATFMVATLLPEKESAFGIAVFFCIGSTFFLGTWYRAIARLCRRIFHRQHDTRPPQ